MTGRPTLTPPDKPTAGSGGSESSGGSSGAGGTQSSAGAGGDGSAGTAPTQSGGSASDPTIDDDVNETRLLPDLVFDEQNMLDTLQEDFVDSIDACLVNEGCIAGLGRRRVVRFGTRTGNNGTADLVMGTPEEDNPLWEFDECHQHWHLEGYAQYDLIDEGSGAVLPGGAKNGFCMRDSEVYDESLARTTCEEYDCDDQGIGVGCADNYGPGLDCQWVDITDIPNGVYQIRVTINAERTVQELDYDNNVGTARIRIDTNSIEVLP